MYKLVTLICWTGMAASCTVHALMLQILYEARLAESVVAIVDTGCEDQNDGAMFGRKTHNNGINMYLSHNGHLRNVSRVSRSCERLSVM